MLKKILSVFFATSLLFSSNITSMAVDERIIVNSGKTEEGIESDLDLNFIVPVTENNITTYYDKNNNVVDITSSNSFETVDEAALPETFDLRDEGRLTSVKDQGTEGFCWSFASMASIESSVLSNPELRAKLGENPQEKLDFSEVGIPWYTCTSVDDKSSFFYGDCYPDDFKGSKGGFSSMIAMGLSSGFGVYPEELIPYSSWGNAYSEALRFYSDYRLKDYVILENDPAVIKTRIMEHGAVCTHYNSFGSNYYLSDDMMQSYYDNGTSVFPEAYNETHMVVIVGWDDNYSKDNFNPLMQPENDGAWLCRNSWGEDFGSEVEGYEGYFWMSYETAVYEYSQFVVQSVDEFDNIYQHQLTETFSVEVESAANIYTAQRDEVIEQICYSNFYATDATIEIYKLNENYSSPDDGVLLTSFDGSVECSGTHTLDVPGEVELKAGDVFSVIIKGDEYIDMKFKYPDGFVKNKSFFSSDDQWNDVADYDVGYFVIKAYTSNKDNDIYKDKLETSINKAEYAKENLSLSADYISDLEKVISDAKYVLNDTFATQNKVDNMVCLLENEMDKFKYLFFEINTIDDFLYLNEEIAKGRYGDAEIVLNTDLDLSDYKTLLPLFAGKSFRGKFNGNGHTLSNMSLNYYSGCGLFSELDGAVVENIKLENCSFNSAMSTGTIAGKAINSIISNCTVTGIQVINDQDFAGGITGYAEDTVIHDCNVINTKIVSRNNASGGIVSFDFGLELYNCNVTNTEIIGNASAILFSEYGGDNCVYDNVVLKSLHRVSVNSNRNVYKEDFSYDSYSFVVFEDDKFTIQPYIGEISGVSSYESTVTQVGEVYEVDINEDVYGAYVYVEYEPLNTNGFTFSFDIATDCITLNGYYNDTDETVTEVVFPSNIGKLTVTDLSYFFSIDSVATIKSIVLPENIGMIYGSTFSGCKELEKIIIPTSVTMIESGAFSECEKLTDVYYGGTQEQWNKIDFGAGNAYLTNATIHFATELPTKPEAPTEAPTAEPTKPEAPTEAPTAEPEAPTEAPTTEPEAPTEAPTTEPTKPEAPTEAPTAEPTEPEAPTEPSTQAPTQAPTQVVTTPTQAPTQAVTTPTQAPTSSATSNNSSTGKVPTGDSASVAILLSLIMMTAGVVVIATRKLTSK